MTPEDLGFATKIKEWREAPAEMRGFVLSQLWEVAQQCVELAARSRIPEVSDACAHSDRVAQVGRVVALACDILRGLPTARIRATAPEGDGPTSSGPGELIERLFELVGDRREISMGRGTDGTVYWVRCSVALLDVERETLPEALHAAIGEMEQRKVRLADACAATQDHPKPFVVRRNRDGEVVGE